MKPMTIKSWTAIIPARGGSKGLPQKNTRLLAGKPLYLHSVNQALDAGAKRVVITTNIDDILTTQHERNVTAIRRPERLCNDEVAMSPVVIHAIENQEIEGVFVLLQPTSPLRSVSDIEAAVHLHSKGKFDLVMSVTQQDSSILKGGFLNENRFKPLVDSGYTFQNRQNLPYVVRPNGAVYVADAHWFLENKGFQSDSIGAIEMSPESSIDIDLLEDFMACEALYQSTQPTGSTQ
ncbi:acylneuraminate cytidylyltransferase family protein [Roseibium aggregatum]|nr:acylneuraminate cytidylyltransferase family protein [Roseibium aggregatum]